MRLISYFSELVAIPDFTVCDHLKTTDYEITIICKLNTSAPMLSGTPAANVTSW